MIAPWPVRAAGRIPTSCTHTRPRFIRQPDVGLQGHAHFHGTDKATKYEGRAWIEILATRKILRITAKGGVKSSTYPIGCRKPNNAPADTNHARSSHLIQP